MNSATPISSLTEAVKDSLDEMLEKHDAVPDEMRSELEDLQLSMRTIHKRTRGLLNFVQTYRKLTSIPKPSLETVNLAGLTNHVLHLLSGEMERQQIALETHLPEDHPAVQADSDQIEQVVINILINAIDAVRSIQNPRITIHLDCTHQEGSCLRITDNGPGIPEDAQAKIFMPFYTTKKEGSGIGLSLARQIMNMHHGEIRVHSQKERGTTCELFFH